MKKVSLSFAWRPTGVSFSARALSRERGIQLQFAADSFCMMTIPPSFLVKDNAKTFFFLFCQDDEDDEGYFGSSLTFVGQILFCYARFVLSSAKIFQSSDAGRGVVEARASHGKTTTLMNMSANVGEFLPKTTSRNPYKKPDQTTVGNDNMQSGIHAIII